MNVADGFLKSFARIFLERFGSDSLFVRTLSDLWTSALARMLIERSQISETDPIALFSDAEALDVIRALSTVGGLKDALLKEPLGDAQEGAIQQAFESAFGAGSFQEWLAAFESRDFARCIELAQRAQ